MYSRKQRIKQEIVSLIEAYPDLAYDDVAYQWILLPHFQLPSNDWQQAETTIILTIPPLYPILPPDVIYIKDDLISYSGQKIGALFPRSQLEGAIIPQGWIRWEIAISDWRPSEQPEEYDNLLSWLELVKRAIKTIVYTENHQNIPNGQG